MADNKKISSPVANPRTAGLNRSGRPKGAKNKTTVAAKEAIAEAFERLGGVDALVTWANKEDNAKVFYSQIWPKIVPLQVGGDPDSPHRIEIVSRVVNANR
jgi:hypothetical protein